MITSLIYLAILYLLGAAVAHGIVDGISDGPEGLGDLIIVVLWPAALVIFILHCSARVLNRVGRWWINNP
jgi:hypothetical protein